MAEFMLQNGLATRGHKNLSNGFTVGVFFFFFPIKLTEKEKEKGKRRSREYFKQLTFNYFKFHHWKQAV